MIPLVDALDAELPQTQCRACDYPACLPYAEAIVRGEAAINQCAPGGERVLAALARLTGQPALPLREPERPCNRRESAKPSASAARCASKPAQWTRSSAAPSVCTR